MRLPQIESHAMILPVTALELNRTHHSDTKDKEDRAGPRDINSLTTPEPWLAYAGFLEPRNTT